MHFTADAGDQEESRDFPEITLKRLYSITEENDSPSSENTTIPPLKENKKSTSVSQEPILGQNASSNFKFLSIEEQPSIYLQVSTHEIHKSFEVEAYSPSK
jgi:hypothetical protein